MATTYSEYLVSVFLWFLKYFLRWEQGYEVGTDPLCLIALGETFPSEFLPSILFLCLGCVSLTYPAMWPASAPSLCYLHLTIQIHTFIHCNSRCLSRDGLEWMCFPVTSSYTVADWKNIFLCHLTEDFLVQYATLRTWSQDVFFWFQLWNVGWCLWCLSVLEINISVKCCSEMNVSGMSPFNSNCYH